MNKEQKEIYEYELIYSQSEIDEWMRVAEEYKEKIKELEAENAKLEEEREKMRQACYIEAGLTPDCNPYYCVRKLKAENAELRARLDKAVELPCKVGDVVYRICPKCNDKHDGSCNNCAWASGITNCGCAVFGLWDDGQYPAHNCTIVPYKVSWRWMPSLLKHFGSKIFLTRAEAEAQLKVLEETKMKCKHCGYEEATTKIDEFYIEKGKRHHIKSKSETKRIPPDEPVSTAEKLLWLAENTIYCFIDNDVWSDECSRAIKFSYRKNGRAEKTSFYVDKSFEEAVNAAYDFAKEQEK